MRRESLPMMELATTPEQMTKVMKPMNHGLIKVEVLTSTLLSFFTLMGNSIYGERDLRSILG